MGTAEREAARILFTRLGLNLADSAGSKRLLMSTTAFRNEPYLGSC